MEHPGLDLGRMLLKHALYGIRRDAVPFGYLAEALTLIPVTLDGRIVERQRISADLLAFQAGSPHAGAHSLDDQAFDKTPDQRLGDSALTRRIAYDSVPGYLIFDRSSSFNAEMIDAMKAFGIQPKRTSFRSPWQNGVAERCAGNCRRDLLDHVIVLNERQLKRLIFE